MKTRRIGFLGGTFDPLHFGHIHLGLEMQEIHGLDEIIVCPTASSPLKAAQAPNASKEQRLQMVQRAVEEIEHWRVIDWEVKRSGISYTIDTIRALHEEAEKNKEKIELFLLLGEDMLKQFDKWKEVEELVHLASPLIAVRSQVAEPQPGISSSLEEICQKGRTRTRVFEISSTLIRDRLKRKLYCGHLVPAKILDFIYQYQLYFY